MCYEPVFPWEGDSCCGTIWGEYWGDSGSMVWCAPCDGRELQLLPGLPLLAFSPGLFEAALALGRKEEAPNPALEPQFMPWGSPETPLAISLLML